MRRNNPTNPITETSSKLPEAHPTEILSNLTFANNADPGPTGSPVGITPTFVVSSCLAKRCVLCGQVVRSWHSV
ncbi:hypothetical protein BJX64DRAFT_263751 [Aspergillus heterothallicus]